MRIIYKIVLLCLIYSSTANAYEQEIVQKTGAYFPTKINTFERRSFDHQNDFVMEYSVSYGEKNHKNLMIVDMLNNTRLHTKDIQEIFEGLLRGLAKKHSELKVIGVLDGKMKIGGKEAYGLVGMLSFKQTNKKFMSLFYLLPWDKKYYMSISSIFPFSEDKEHLLKYNDLADSFITSIERKQVAE